MGNTDQHSKIGTFNISPTYTRVVSNYSVFNLGASASRKDIYNYFPSGNPLADLGPSEPADLVDFPNSFACMNAGVHSDFSYVRGINNIKIGAQYSQTFVRESDSLGIVESTYNSPCVNATTGTSLPGYEFACRLHSRPTWP